MILIREILMINLTLSALARLVLYDVLFSIFVIFIEPRILPGMKAMTANPYNNPEPVIWLGILIVAALAAEPFGVYLKFKSIGSRMLENKSAKPGDHINVKWGMLICFMHAAVAVPVMIFGFMAFGFSMYNNEKMFVLFIYCVLTREGFIFYFANFMRVPQSTVPGAEFKNIIADLCLFFYGVIAYTATWRVIPESDMTVTAESYWVMGLLLLVTSILFLMFYVSSNMASIFEGFIYARTKKQVYLRYCSLLIVVISVLGPMCSLPSAQKKTSQDSYNTQMIEKQKAEELLRMETEKKKGR